MYLFVYYKFKPEDYPNIARDANAFLAAIKHAVPGLNTRLLKRPEVSATGEQTWMETYEFEGVHKEMLQSTLSALIQDSGLPNVRHLEWFVEV